MTDLEAFIPWPWTLTSATHGTCPPMSRVLGTYAVAAIIISIVGLIFGHKRVVDWLSCHFFTHYSGSWRWTWIFSFGLSLGAAAVNTAIIVRHENRDSDYPLYFLFLLQLTLPRVSFLCLLLVFWLEWHCSGKVNEYGDNFMAKLSYGSSAAGALIAELVLQLPLLYFLGKIAYFAFRNDYFPGKENYNQVPKGAKMMHTAAVVHLVGSCVALAVSIGLGTNICSSSNTSKHGRMSKLIAACVFLGILTFCADWVFWAGFLNLAGDIYCVPEIELQVTIRIVFSAVAAFIGGAG